MSSTRLTSLDASFLEVESSTAHMHVGWASLFAPAPGKRKPRFTFVSEGYPLRRFELTSKAGQVGELVDAWHDGLLS